MGLPPHDGPPGPPNGGTFYDDTPGYLPNETPAFSNGPSVTPRQRNGSTDLYPPQERNDRSRNVSGSDTEPRQRKEPKRRPSGQQRMCGKCQQYLTGQFVRALGDTYHLECFTCHVSLHSRHVDSRSSTLTVFAGLRQDRCLEVLPSPGCRTWSISSLRNGLLPTS